MAAYNPEIKRRMNENPDDDIVIMKSQMQEVEERNNRENDYKAQKKLKEKAKYAREGAIEEVTRPNGAKHYRRAGKTGLEKLEEKRENRAERRKSKAFDDDILSFKFEDEDDADEAMTEDFEDELDDFEEEEEDF